MKKMPLGTEVDLSLDHIVLDEDPALPRKGHSSLCLFSAHVYCDHGRPSQLLQSSCTNRRPKIHGRFLCRLVFCFHCSPEGLIEITTRTSTLAYRYQLVQQKKTWNDAQRYCKDKYRASLVVIDSYVDELALKDYLNPLLGQLACHLLYS